MIYPDNKLKQFQEYLKSKDIWSFENYCNCGGYASSMNGRNPEHPHTSWCAQSNEWEDWWEKFENDLRN